MENRKSFLEGLAKKVKEEAVTRQEQRLLNIIQSTGSVQQESSNSLISVSHPELGANSFNNMLESDGADVVNLKQMLACSMHLGHATHKLNPKMVPYVFGERAGIHILDLEKTLACLRVAYRAVMDIVAQGGSVLFVGTRDSIQRLTYEAAVDCGQYYVNLRWLGGTITNRGNVLRSESLLPDLLIVLDYPNDAKALHEANKGNIPVMAICDTDCDPSLVTYPIPANDDAFASVELVARTLSLAAIEGRKRRQHPSRIVDSASEFVRQAFKPKHRNI